MAAPTAVEHQVPMAVTVVAVLVQQEQRLLTAQQTQAVEAVVLETVQLVTVVLALLL